MGKERSRTGLFMTELILALLFFSIAAAVCLQVYAKAVQTAERAETLKLALNSTENLIQLLKAEGLGAEMETSVSWTEEGDSLALYYDGEGQPCRREDACYGVELRLEEENGLRRAWLVSRNKEGEEIYSIALEWVKETET